MRVLVTGANGFVGRALVPVLAARSCEITVTDRHCGGLEQLAAIRAVEGDITDEQLRRIALADADAVIHLATVPGGAAEADPDLARQVNVVATMALSGEFAALRPGGSFVFASSIAVLGHPATELVDDAMPLAPQMLYGAHKAMIETWLATLSRRGELAAMSVRLPGIVARPRGPSGMKSAFLSDVFHALAARRSLVLPVSASGTTWLMSVNQVAQCLAHALDASTGPLPDSRAVTLPALRVTIGELVAEIGRQCVADPELVRYQAEETIERAFGQLPPLFTAKADHLGFAHDGDLQQLVRSALQTL